MATIFVTCGFLRNCPQGWSWGWSHNCEKRLHVQPFPTKRAYRKCFVWLEKVGDRFFEHEGDIPHDVLNAVRSRLLHRRRLLVEAEWVELLIRNEWIRLDQSEAEVTMVIYPGFVQERVIRNRSVNKAFQSLQARYGSPHAEFGRWGSLALVPPPPAEPCRFLLPRLIWGDIS